jgi:thiamine pyrophosphokinase
MLDGPFDTVVVVTGAAGLDPEAVRAVAGADRIVAADGGLDHARAAGLVPDVLVGDLDSVSAAGLRWAEANIPIERHPADKSATDTELALQRAVAMQPTRVVLIAARGDRLDHAIAAVGALGAAELAAVPAVEGWWGDDQLLIGRPGRSVHVARPAGTTFSVLALHGPCRGVTVSGSRWPLTDADLGSMFGLGVSNEVVDPPARIDVAAGVVTVIVPRPLGTAQTRPLGTAQTRPGAQP